MDSTKPPSPQTKRGNSKGFLGRLMGSFSIPRTGRVSKSSKKSNTGTVDRMIAEGSPAHNNNSSNNDSQSLNGSSRRRRGHNAVFMSVTSAGNHHNNHLQRNHDNSSGVLTAGSGGGGGGGAVRSRPAFGNMDSRRSLASITSMASNGDVSTSSYQDYCFSETVGVESFSTDFVNSTGAHSYTPWKQMWM